MIRKRSFKRGFWPGQSLRSVFVNMALRTFVRHQFNEHTKPPTEMREFMLKYIEGQARYPGHTDRWEDGLGGVPTHWFRSRLKKTAGVLLYLHGGAFVIETPRAHGAFVSELAHRVGMIAAMPGYRLAPEEPFPAAVEDSIAAYKGLLELGFDPAEIVVAGDSAGGNLTLVLLQQCLELGLPLPAAGVFISPGMELGGQLRSHYVNTWSDPMFNQYALQQVITHYLQNDYELIKDPRVSPLRGRFKGLPPLFFIASDIEIFRDCSIYAAEKAEENNVEVECHIWRGMSHCFPVMMTHVLPEAGIATNDIVNFIERQLNLSRQTIKSGEAA